MLSSRRSGSFFVTSNGISSHASFGCAGHVQQLRHVVEGEGLRDDLARAVIRVACKVAGISGHALQRGQAALASFRGAGRERGRPGLIPEGHAGIIVLALVPTGAFVVRVLVRRHPAEVFERDLDALLEDDGIVEMPAVRAGMPADNAPLIEIGDAEIGRQRLLQAPRRQKIVLRARSPDRRRRFRRQCRFSRRPRRTTRGCASARPVPCRHNAPCLSCPESRNPAPCCAGYSCRYCA